MDAYKTPDDFEVGLENCIQALWWQDNPDLAPISDIANLDVGFGVYLRGYWNLQELPTDEAVYSWTEDGGIRPLHWQTWTPTNSFIGALYTPYDADDIRIAMNLFALSAESCRRQCNEISC